jgi:excisionase family DNA binding protein
MRHEVWLSSTNNFEGAMEKLLTIDEAAEALGTTSRFPRRLVAERRIRFVHVGRHVRIPVSALEDFVAGGTVQPVDLIWAR